MPRHPSNLTPALTRHQVREVDRLAIEAFGIPGIVLMENAGINATAVILDLLADECGVGPDEARVAVLCGGGNNGGDGYVIARHLHNWSVAVTIFALVDPAKLAGDAAINHAICAKLDLDIRPLTDDAQLDAAADIWGKQHVLVDAMLGTGFQGEVRPHMAGVIERVNRLGDTSPGPVVVAVDLPSGLDCDTGRPSNATVRADATVTFVAEKVGFHAPDASAWLGRVVVADIGVPAQLVQQVLST